MQLNLLDSSMETRQVRSPIAAKTCAQNQLLVFIYEGADVDFEIIVFPKLAQRKKPETTQPVPSCEHKGRNQYKHILKFSRSLRSFKGP